MWWFGACLRGGPGSVSLVAALDLRGLFQSMSILICFIWYVFYQHFIYSLPDWSLTFSALRVPSWALQSLEVSTVTCGTGGFMCVGTGVWCPVWHRHLHCACSPCPHQWTVDELGCQEHHWNTQLMHHLPLRVYINIYMCVWIINAHNYLDCLIQILIFVCSKYVGRLQKHS